MTWRRTKELVLCRLLRRHAPTRAVEHRQGKAFHFVFCGRCLHLIGGTVFHGQHPLPRKEPR